MSVERAAFEAEGIVEGGPGGRLSGEYDNTGALIREYVYLNGEPLAQIDAGSPEVLTYLHTDHLMTPRYGTNSGGTQVWSWDSGAFGKEAPTGSATVNLRFPGQYYDPESGLIYNWNRTYNPAIGRYISSDPVGLAAGLNTYSYAHQSPAVFSDPKGLTVWRGYIFNATGDIPYSSLAKKFPKAFGVAGSYYRLILQAGCIGKGHVVSVEVLCVGADAGVGVLPLSSDFQSIEIDDRYPYLSMQPWQIFTGGWRLIGLNVDLPGDIFDFSIGGNIVINGHRSSKLNFKLPGAIETIQDYEFNLGANISGGASFVIKPHEVDRDAKQCRPGGKKDKWLAH